MTARVPLILCLMTIIMGCARPSELPGVVDEYAFRYLGGTLFASPDQLTMKEIHLDNGTLLGRQVIVEGAVMEMSEHYTYLVLSDETARILVVLTDMESIGPILESERPRVMRVLGTVESGKKGLPFVMARSINILKEPEAKDRGA